MKNKLVRFMAIAGVAVIMSGLVAGCGSSNNTEMSDEEIEEVEELVEGAIGDTDDMADASLAEAIKAASNYFTYCVYVKYAEDDKDPAKDYFYIFNDDGTGRTEDGAAHGAGVSFNCTQEAGKVTFSYGGDDGDTDVFIVEESDNGIIKGRFEGTDEVLVFEPLYDADPDNFDSEEYLNSIK
ncbi:MAG: hypothetical protein K6B41_11575 [Butyrivibrio sp.]|nr:hypothetical protein [Butyrivibrio sp.]